MEKQLPPELLDGIETDQERAAILGRWAIMEDLRLPFTPDKKLQIARNEMTGYAFGGAVLKTWNGLYGTGGLLRADLELSADGLGVFDNVGL